MGWLSYIYPQTIARSTSRFNKDIRVNLENGSFKLLVNGSRQSGPYIEMLWKKAFRAFGISGELPVRRILVLGVGGGTVIHLLRSMFSPAQIIGVDIDAVILEIGKKYFDLSGMNGLTLIVDDARKFVQKSKITDAYDLIIIDIFLGSDIPPFVNSDTFLRQIRNCTAKHGAVVINYLQEHAYAQESDIFFSRLKNIFRSARDFRIFRNRFFITSV